MKRISAEDFTKATGSPPEQDDLDRVNCPCAGTIGHGLCGWCPKHNKPVFSTCCIHVDAFGESVT